MAGNASDKCFPTFGFAFFIYKKLFLREWKKLRMIISKLEKKENFTNNEKEIADFILKNLDEIHLLSAEGLAKKAFVSKATVVRFCKKFDVKGYRDFQRQLDREVNEMKKIQGLLSEEPVNSSTSYDEIISIIPSLYEKVIGATKLNLDSAVMEKIIEKLKNIEKIEIYGTGISYILAKLASFKFMTLGIESAAYDGLNEHYIISTEKGEEDMALIISLSGNNPYMIRIAEYLKKRNVFVVGIGNGSSEEIKKACSEYIEIHAPNYILNFEMVSAFTGINYVLDVFFTSLLVSNYYKNVNTSLEVSKNYEMNEPKVSKKL